MQVRSITRICTIVVLRREYRILNGTGWVAWLKNRRRSAQIVFERI